MRLFPSMTSIPGGESMPANIFDYEVIDHIGDGARSRIYAVSHPESRQLYALKHVIRKTAKDDRFIEQLLNEYEVGSRIMHPALRRIVETKTTRNMLLKITEAALVMELFDGLPLEMSLPGRLPAIISIFIPVAQALEAMHNAGFVHCDLKPNNILLSAGGTVKVIDLGQACPVGTAKKRIQGTPDYIAPEQVKCKAVSVRTDIFNFGATMYWALSGRKLPTLFTLKKSEYSFIVDDQFAAPHTINPIIPETLSNFVMECVRSDPRKRPADMSEVQRRLEVILHSVQRCTQNGRSGVA
ncbi:MAG: serine/threonine protein kinase [Tepidisphaeraceae bacterium]